MTDNRRLYRGKPQVRFHTMAKPIGPTCNLDCTYCYYLSKAGLLDIEPNRKMSDEVLENFVRQYIEGHNSKEIVFSWQGGEPTLLGLDYFKRIVELQQKYKPKHSRIENDLQTNGTLLDEDWCHFLRENNFLVGLSIDGPKELHDNYRVDRAGKGTFDAVFAASTLLRKRNVPFATLSCVNYKTAKHPLEVYRFLRDEVGSKRMQFIPIVEPKVFREVAPQRWTADQMPILGSTAAEPGTKDSVVEEWSTHPVDFGDFLCTIFDEWLANDLGDIYVHYFDAAVETWMGRVNPLCSLAPMCGKGTAIETDGSVYCCDHYVYADYLLGNIEDKSLKEMVLSEEQERFGTDKERTLPQRCRHCKWQFACFGECPKNRFIRTPQGEAGLNYLCEGLRKFFAHIDEPIRKIITEHLGEEVRIPDATGSKLKLSDFKPVIDKLRKKK